MDKAADPSIWEILFFIVNCAVVVVMMFGFLIFVGAGQWLLNLSIFRALFAGKPDATMGENAAARLEAGASVLIDDANAKTRRLMWRGLAVSGICFLYFIAAIVISVLMEK